MKKIVFIAIAAIAITTAAQAQDSSSMMKKDQSARMHRGGGDAMEQLNLTPDQKDKMDKLREQNKTKVEAIRNNASLSDEQKQEQLKALRMEQHKNMESILTDEQKTKWKQTREAQMKERREMKSTGDSTMQR